MSIAPHLEDVRRNNHTSGSGNSQNGDFDPEQAALLQDMARSSAPEAHSMYEYADGGLQLNGYTGGAANGIQSNDLSQNHQLEVDLDTVALLQELANFEHNAPANPQNISNDHFASLVEAAANAGGSNETSHEHATSRRTTRHSKALEESGPNSTPIHHPKRKRANSEHEEQHSSKSKRTRTSARQVQAEDEAQLAREREIWGDEDDHRRAPDLDIFYDQTPVGATEARAAGVHSAAALFRKPTAASKKYTRPPMSRLFLSLELTAEEFLHLQAAAKTYMLDPAHPERRDCVGSRGGSDGTMVRLKLFECVRYFLDELGWGEKSWGANTPSAATRTLIWPKNSNKIITLATPLLRRVVTNERQRLYAIETRKDGRPSEAKGTNITSRNSRTPASDRSDPKDQTDRNDSLVIPEFTDIDPKLDQYHYNLNESFDAQQTAKSIPTDPSLASSSFLDHHPPPPPASSETQQQLRYTLNILHNGHRIRPRLDLTPSTCPGWASLIQHVHGIVNEKDVQITRVQVLNPSGLVEVDGEVWEGILRGIAECDWMDGDVKFVVEVSF